MASRTCRRRAVWVPAAAPFRREDSGRENGPQPGAKVLGREGAARRLPQVLVDVGRVDRLTLARLVAVLEELLARKVLAPPDDLGDAMVRDLHTVALAALAAELEAELRPLHGHVTVPQRGEPEGSVLPHVGRVADTNGGGLEQAHDGRQHLGPRQARAGRGRPSPGRECAAGRGRIRRAVRTWSRRGRCATANGSGTACGPRASRPTAWRWPCATGQIQTSRHAGGMARVRMRRAWPPRGPASRRRPRTGTRARRDDGGFRAGCRGRIGGQPLLQRRDGSSGARRLSAGVSRWRRSWFIRSSK